MSAGVDETMTMGFPGLPTPADFVVVDVETTGFSAARGDRVIEIGVVPVSFEGVIGKAWSTLLRVDRPVGATHVHGIRADDLVSAPTFTQVAHHIWHAIQGRVFVAHNASFDLAFIQAELSHAGVSLPGPLPSFCTMKTARSFVRTPSRKLSDCIAAIGVENPLAHSAADDALVTAKLFQHYLQSGKSTPWVAAQKIADQYPWHEVRVPPPSSTLLAR